MACRQWAREEGARRAVKQVVLAFPPEGPMSAAAMRQDARFVRNYSACGGSMARVLDVTRLLEALRPELQARLEAAHAGFTGTLAFHTDIGEAALRITPDGVTQETAAARRDTGTHLTVNLPQTELARLALGAFPPEALLARLPEPPRPEAAHLLEILFPFRHPHMHLPDRY